MMSFWFRFWSVFFFFKQKTAYEMRIRDWSSDVCSSDLLRKPDSPTLVATRDAGTGLPKGPRHCDVAVSGEVRAMLNKKKRRFSRKVGHRGGFSKRAFGDVVAIAANGTSVGAAHSLVLPMLIDGSIEDREASVFTYQNQVSASLAAACVEADTRGLPLLDALYTVEEQLNEACGPLQEAGRRTIEGEELGSLLQFAVFNAMEICAAKSEEVAYYVRLARSYSSPAVAAPKTTVKTAWD